MKATLKYHNGMYFEAKSDTNQTTFYDSSLDHGGTGKAATPMENLLTSLAACSAMDVVSILEKKRKTINSLTIDIDGLRADEHPRVFTKVHLIYNLSSNDAKIDDLNRAVELSMDKYCSVSAMFKMSGCELTRECHLI
jgi:putative redox protein